MTEYAVVTGAGSGIGRRLAVELCKRSIAVIGVGRRHSALEETCRQVRAAGGEGFHAVSADLGTAQGRQKVSDAVGERAKVRFLVHLAGVFPIERFEDVTPEGLRQAIAINVEARLFLTQILLKRLAPGARILFVKSGASERPRIGCIQVCVSMAASFMLQRCLTLEFQSRGILVGSTKPGFVQTEMMDTALSATPDIFPDIEAIRASPMISADTCARYVTWLLSETSDAEFAKDSWNIEDESHHRFWLKGLPLHVG